MTYEKKSVIELREIAKERKIKGISTLKKKELIETLEKYDQENYKEVKSKEETHGEHQGRKHYQKEFPPVHNTLPFVYYLCKVILEDFPLFVYIF